ncbi:MAG: DNA polymerase III subunit gamma/tau [Terriglobia bacterium]
MSYQVLARKWRPQTFDEIVGQDAIAQTLKNAVRQNRIAHAYLFAGARGVGKTSTARILAKALNCVQGPTITPCNECDPCREITNGNSIDVLEIDAASNRGIDEIRELRENVKYAAAKDRYKVFIIDEVHMLTTEAFNALLKTLEEPPPQVVFVLATTEHHKVPSTILSRCQHFNFRAIGYPEILSQLSRIAESEKIQISSASLQAIARASEGSMRDAQSQLEQIVSFCGSEIRDELVKQVLGVVPHQLLEELTEAIHRSDARHLIQIVDQLVQSGLNLQHFIRELIGHIRNLALLKIVGEDPVLIPLTPAELSRNHELANQFSEEDLTRFFSILVTTESEMRWAAQPRFQLEMGLLKILQAKRLVPIEELLAHLGASSPMAAPSTTLSPTHSSPLPSDPKGVSSHMRASSPNLAAAAAVKRQSYSQSPSEGKNSPEELFHQVRHGVFEKSPMVSSLLDHASALKFKEAELEIVYLEKERFSFDMMQPRENLLLVQEVAASLTGKQRPVLITLSKDAPATPVSNPVPDPVPPAPKTGLLEQIKEDATVKNFLETFQGEIVEIKELKP